MDILFESTAFADGELIPPKHTCDGQDVSPPLKWKGVPEGAKSIAIICDDPDAPGGTWVHWVIYNLPASVSELREGLPRTDVVSIGGRQGTNDFSRLGYGGPCPPRGAPHRYYFRIYALDIDLQLQAGSTRSDVVRAMEGHILGQGQLMGKYGRR